MHYAPHSAREFLPGEDHPHKSHADRAGTPDYDAVGSAPLYSLAALMGVLIGLDVVLGLLGPQAAAYQAPFGIRLALAAAVLGGSRILYHTLEGAFAGRIGADLALTIATLAAIILQEYFVAAMVVFIATCGECMEAVTVGKARSAIRKILELTPRIVHVRRDSQEIDVPLDALTVGDLVIVRPGERIAADGVVLAGRSTVDQSALTGESLPVDKQEGDAVFAGTLNHFGALETHVERLGADTTLGQVIRLVAEASERKAPLERAADRYARYFLPVVLSLALVTHAANNWGSRRANWMPTLAVLVVACPCPLILATPAAVMAAMAWLARRGVVIKGSIALERLASVDAFAFDKTGTLTEGRLSLADVRVLASLGRGESKSQVGEEAELLRLAAAAEQRSEHPLARLLVHEAEGRNFVLPPVVQFTAHPGAGVVTQVRVGGQWSEVGGEEGEVVTSVVVGNRRLMEQEGIRLGDEVERVLEELDAAGQTPLLVAVNGTIRGVIGARDTVRGEAREVLHELHHLGVSEMVLLTGDRRPAAEAVAKRVGFLAAVKAEMLPADKARWIEQAHHEGKRVAMVGDGVNDAPALAAADVGLALGGVGSDIAAEAGDVVLMGDPLAHLPGLLRLARYTVRIIRQNILAFAFGVNLLGVVLTAWIVPRWSEAWAKSSPVAAAIFHEFASLAVMLNAMRLLWFERWHESGLGRLLGGAALAADRLAAALDPRRAIAWAMLYRRRLWRGLATTALVLPVLLWSGWNATVVPPGSQAVVTQFGRYQATLGPGFYWRLPPPIEYVAREETDRLRTVELGFRTRSLPAARAGRQVYAQALEWDNPHVEGRYERRPEESLLLTGDEVLVELTAVVQYRVQDLRRYLFATKAPAQALQSAAESVLRDAAARMTLEQLLTAGRRRLEEEATAALRRQIAPYGSGIEVLQVVLQDVHPPLEVVRSFREVASAFEDRQRMINEAEADYVRQLLEAAGKDVAAELASRGDAATRSSPNPGQPRPAEADIQLTDKLWESLLPKLAGTAAARVLQAEAQALRQTLVAAGQAQAFAHRVEAYQASPDVARLRLYWEAIEKPLAEREKVILDPKAAGRRQLFFSDVLNPAPALLGSGLRSESESSETSAADEPARPRQRRAAAPAEQQGSNP